MAHLSPLSNTSVSSGYVVVNVGSDVWLPWAQGQIYTGSQIGLALTPALPGNPFQVQTIGLVPYNIFQFTQSNVTSSVVAGTTPSRGSSGQLIGTCDINGNLFLPGTVVGGSPGGGGGGGISVGGTGPITTIGGIVQGTATTGTPDQIFAWKHDNTKPQFQDIIATNVPFVVNVRAAPYNAKGDGVTDDTAAIQAAINVFSGTSTAGTIYFPAGIYKITSTLTYLGNNGIGCRFMGDHCAETIGSIIQWQGAANGVMLQTTAMNFCRFEALRFDANNLAKVCVQVLRQASPLVSSANNWFQHCQFVNFIGINTTVTTASFTQPNIASSITINLASNAGLAVNDFIYIYKSGVYRLTAVDSVGGHQITADAYDQFDLEYAPGNTVPSSGFPVVSWSSGIQANDGLNTDNVSGIWCDYCVFNGAASPAFSAFAGFAAWQSATGNTEDFYFRGCNFGSALFGFYFGLSQNQMLFSDCNFGVLGVACVVHGYGQSTILQCAIEQDNTAAGSYQHRGKFLVTGQYSKAYVQACEIVINNTNELYTTGFYTRGGALMLRENLVSTNQFSPAADMSIQATGLQSEPVIVENCEWGNFGATVDPLLGQIRVMSGGNVYTRPLNAFVETTPTQIYLRGNILQSNAGTYFPPPFEGMPPNRPTMSGMFQENVSAGVKVSYAGQPRRTTTFYEIDFGAMSGAGATATFNIGQLVGKARLCSIIVDVTTGFTGGTLSNVTLSIGDNVTANEYILAKSISSATQCGLSSDDLGIGGSPVQGYLIGSWTSQPAPMTANFTATGDTLNHLTQGVVKIYITTEYFA